MKVLAAFTRLYVAPEDVDATVAFHASLFDATPAPPFAVPGLEVTVRRVGPVLVIAGSPAALDRVRDSALTLVVDSIEETERWLVEHGARITQPRKAVPTGFNLHAEHPGGVAVEYVQLVGR